WCATAPTASIPHAVVRSIAATPDTVSYLRDESGAITLWLGQPTSGVGARCDRSESAECAHDFGEPFEERSRGCADAGSSGAPGSGTAVAHSTTQRENASGPGAGASPRGGSPKSNQNGQCGARDRGVDGPSAAKFFDPDLRAEGEGCLSGGFEAGTSAAFARDRGVDTRD